MKNLKYISIFLLFLFLGSEVFAQKRTRKKRTSHRNQNIVQTIPENKVVEKEERNLRLGCQIRFKWQLKHKKNRPYGRFFLFIRLICY